MKSVSLGQNLHQFHQKCVCQICSCQKHKCPHSKIHIPHIEISTYQKEFHAHPINTWQKPPPQKAQPYRPYDYINSAYREHFPGQKPQMRQKIVPRVKDQKKLIPFNSNSEYFRQYGAKSVPKTKVFIKDNQFYPDRQPFNASTTYGSEFAKKLPNPHQKNKPQEAVFPQGYHFNPNTTYNSDFYQKKPKQTKNYKPKETVAQKGPHDLITIYRQEFKQKPQPELCPVLKMPSVPASISHPSQHLSFNKFSGSWVET